MTLTYNDWNTTNASAPEAVKKAAKELLEGSNDALYLHHNDIGCDGMKALAEALKYNKSLKELYLRDNNVS